MSLLKKCLLILASTLALQVSAVELNKGSADELSTIKGIGPATADRIIAERKSGGNFKSWDDFISRVSGVGDKTATKFSADGLTVNGGAYKTAAAPAKAVGKDKGATAKPAAASKEAAADKKKP